jgi:hypothetical protein
VVIDRDDYSEPPMPPVTHKHTLTIAEAVERLHGFTAALKRQYGKRVAKSSEAWDGGVLTFDITGVAGRNIYGTVTVTGDVVTVEAKGDIPRFIEWRVTNEIKAALKEALGS